MPPDTPETTSGKFLVGALIFLFGAVVTQLWTRFRNRLATLTWTADTARLAASAEGDFGKISVLYGDQPVGLLYLVTLTLRNESTTDLENLHLTYGFSDGTRILMSSGQLVGAIGGTTIPDDFFVRWRGANERQDFRVGAYFVTHREYLLPVFNRASVVKYELLVTHEDSTIVPALSVSCAHKGVQLRNRAPAKQILGVNEGRATLAGFVLSFLVAVQLSRQPLSPFGLSIGAWVAGLTSLLVGALALRLLRVVARIMS
jgi:hypothetical protein